jgi:hypothetical protein
MVIDPRIKCYDCGIIIEMLGEVDFEDYVRERQESVLRISSKSAKPVFRLSANRRWGKCRPDVLMLEEVAPGTGMRLVLLAAQGSAPLLCPLHARWSRDLEKNNSWNVRWSGNPDK